MRLLYSLGITVFLQGLREERYKGKEFSFPQKGIETKTKYSVSSISVLKFVVGILLVSEMYKVMHVNHLREKKYIALY
jgi:hypothetical protein